MTLSIRTARARRARQVDGGRGAAACERTAIDYARNLLVGARFDRAARARGLENLDDDDIARAALRTIDESLGSSPAMESKKLWEQFRRFMARGRPPLVRPAALDEPLQSNLRLVGEVIGLDELETELFQFFAVLRLVHPLVEITDVAGALSLLGASEVCGAAVARPREEVMAVLSPKGRLVGSGLLTVEDDPANLSYKLQIHGGLVDLLIIPGLQRQQLYDTLLPVAPEPTLDVDDYPHLAEEVALARRIIEGALRARRPGVNVLLYGATGTGKSELARIIARRAAASLHVAGKEDENGESACASERLASLLLGNRLLASGGSLLLFDEVEDLFERSPFSGLLGGDERRDRSSASKQWFNLLLENNPVPTFWITNDQRGMDPAFRRRFAYAIEFRPLGVAQRRRVWGRHLGPSTCLAADEVESLASRFTMSAGQIATTVGSARLATPGEPDRATIEQIAASLEKLVRESDPPRRPLTAGVDYLSEATNTSCDLGSLIERLSTWRPSEGPGVSLCLHGPSGTGKSELVHHLGRRMDRRVLVRRVSDILSMWVGQAERHIAESFAEAERDGALLLFDEADSFLRDRREARQSWEITQVNEFLQQLEATRAFVACTTNLYRGLDQASLRRFVFKIEFGFLRPSQARLLFDRMLRPLLSTPPDPDDERSLDHGLKRLSTLTPGDFAAVLRRVRVLGTGAGEIGITTLVRELGAEVAAKEQQPRAVGFRA